MQDDLGVGLGLEHRTVFLKLFAQFAEILDDAVVNHGEAFSGVRMSIVLGRPAMRGPARMSDAGVTRERLGSQSRLEILELAFGAAALEMVAFECRDAGGIIAAIFQPLERIHQLLRDRAASENADNAAHAGQYLPIKRRCACIS